MAPPQLEIEGLIDQLYNDRRLAIVYASDSKRGYPIQRTLLATASQRLANRCYHEDNTLPHINDKSFRIFLGWLLRRKIIHEEPGQLELAMAWNFGWEYEIPEFQDEVIKALVEELQESDVCPHAVHEAYRVKNDTKLQRALVAQLAIDMRLGNYGSWSREKFVEYGLGTVTDFLLDLNQAIPRTICDCESGEPPTIEADNFLVRGSRRVI